MSKSHDRERAESGQIFRNQPNEAGKLVSKEDWYRANPTPQMRKERQAVVDAAVQDEMLKKEVASNVVVPKRYYCTVCRKHHVKPSKAWQEHTSFILEEGGL